MGSEKDWGFLIILIFVGLVAMTSRNYECVAMQFYGLWRIINDPMSFEIMWDKAKFLVSLWAKGNGLFQH